jgi:uncharacterized SAM-binding protein YcdF (DUF218 family)
MFVFKQIVSPLFLPVSLCLEFLLLGLVLLWFTRRQRAGKVLVTIAAFILAMFGYGIISDRLLEPIEYRFPPLFQLADIKALDSGEQRHPRWVVVLAGGHTYDPNLPLTCRISRESLVRLIEGIRLYRQKPGCKLLLSGRGFSASFPEAETLADLARSIGVNPNDLVLEAKSRDTKDQARNLLSVLGSKPFILVTSASHMPRAVAMMRKLGLQPVPAPTGHRTHKREGVLPLESFPNAEGLLKAEMAIHEYLGLVWARIMSQT